MVVVKLTVRQSAVFDCCPSGRLLLTTDGDEESVVLLSLPEQATSGFNRAGRALKGGLWPLLAEFDIGAAAATCRLDPSRAYLSLMLLLSWRSLFSAVEGPNRSTATCCARCCCRAWLQSCLQESSLLANNIAAVMPLPTAWPCSGVRVGACCSCSIEHGSARDDVSLVPVRRCANWLLVSRLSSLPPSGLAARTCCGRVRA